jgi:hypothetical protein
MRGGRSPVAVARRFADGVTPHHSLPAPGRLAEQTVAAYGVRATFRSNRPEALALLVANIPGRWKPSPAKTAPRSYSLLVEDEDGRNRYDLYRDDERLVRSTNIDRVREFLIGSVGFYFAEHSSRLTFVHAGVVAVGGQAILLPGLQSTGKTTLTGALVRAGARYLSDDYAPVDDGGRIHPFPRPLSVRRRSRRPKLTPVEAFGGVQEQRPLPVGLVVLAPYGPVRRWRPRRLPPGRGALEILAYTASAQTRPRQALDRLGRVVAHAPVLKGRRGEADETAAAILERLKEAPEAARALRDA